MSKKVISISFNSSWILAKRNDDILPVEAFTNSIKKETDIQVLNKTLTDCELLFDSSTFEEEMIIEKIVLTLKDNFDITQEDNVYEINVSDYSEPEIIENHEIVQHPVEKNIPQVEVCIPTIEKINSLIGAEEFKSLANECVKVAPGIKKYNTYDTFTNQCYLFSINDGNGLSTYLSLFSGLLSELGLFNSAGNDIVVEEKIGSPQGKEIGANPFSPVLSHFQSFAGNKGKIICIDISEWMTKTNEKIFRDFLSEIDDHTGKNIIIFRIPFVEKEILFGLKKSLGDILFIRDISFVPFDNDEIVKCAQECIDSFGFSMKDEAWDVFNARILEEKNDGRFYGINTVNKVVREMVYRKQLNNAINGIDDTVIKKNEILALASSYSEDEKSGYEMLDDFIGLDSIKSRVEEIVAQIELSLKNENLGAPCIHMRFVGNPGTGKTTVARVIGKILKEKGILRNGNFFEYSGRDFCGRYVGETAPKTAAMCRDAYGSVLFIDEAYSLFRGDGFSSVDYGREAIDTLIAEMENHRSDLVVIMAGYPDDMDNLMKGNAGLESRMPYIIDFPNYSRNQLFEIYMQMVNKSFSYDDEFSICVKEYFDALPDEVVNSKEFSNARFCRNLFERTWGKAVLRAQLAKDDCYKLTKEDFLIASSEKEFKKIMQKPNKSLGFI